MKNKYSKAEANVNKIVETLEKHQIQLMKDAAIMDKMYALNLNYFKELSMYILAGKKKLEEIRSTELPQLMEKHRQAVFRRMRRQQRIWTLCANVLKRKSMIWS